MILNGFIDMGTRIFMSVIDQNVTCYRFPLAFTVA